MDFPLKTIPPFTSAPSFPGEKADTQIDGATSQHLRETPLGIF